MNKVSPGEIKSEFVIPVTDSICGSNNIPVEFTLLAILGSTEASPEVAALRALSMPVGTGVVPGLFLPDELEVELPAPGFNVLLEPDGTGVVPGLFLPDELEVELPAPGFNVLLEPDGTGVVPGLFLPDELEVELPAPGFNVLLEPDGAGVVPGLFLPDTPGFNGGSDKTPPGL